jgi:hypothetical protein
MAKNNTPTYSTTYPVTGTGGAGTNVGNITVTGGTGVNWATLADTSWYTKQPKVKITDTDIELDGLSMRQTLIDLQSRMAIMIPNPELEQEFIELRECADRYRELERTFLEQKAIWETLKRTDK